MIHFKHSSFLCRACRVPQENLQLPVTSLNSWLLFDKVWDVRGVAVIITIRSLKFFFCYFNHLPTNHMLTCPCGVVGFQVKNELATSWQAPFIVAPRPSTKSFCTYYIMTECAEKHTCTWLNKHWRFSESLTFKIFISCARYYNSLVCLPMYSTIINFIQL